MKTLFIVCGRPASGKSTYAAKLAVEKHAALLDIDTVTERLVRTALIEKGSDPNDRDSEYFKSTFRVPIYETLFDIAKENLFHIDVVLVGPFTREIENSDWPSKMEGILGTKVEVHYIYCPEDLRRERLQKRGNPRDGGKLLDLDAHCEYYGSTIPCCPHILVDTSL